MAIGVHHVYLADEDLGIFDENKFTLEDAFTIKASSGLDIKAFNQGIVQMNPLALQTFVWWLKHRKGETVDRASIDFNVADLRLEEEPDPTQATTSGSVVADTSAS
jgi:hypothetical protein